MKPGRNDPCPCGSGKKFKKCCEGKLVSTPKAVAQARMPAQAEIDQLAALFNAGRYVELEHSATLLTERCPQSGLAWKILGISLQRQGKDAIAVLRKAVKLLPRDPDAHNNLGNALHDLGRLDEAVASYRRALAIEPGIAGIHNNLGNALYDLGRLDEAVKSCRRALGLEPDFVEAHNNLGNALHDLGRLDEAAVSYRRALELSPGTADIHNNLSNVLRDLGQLDAAVACLRRALELNPVFAEAHNNLGNALRDLHRLDEAAASHERALKLKPDYAEAWFNRGNALWELKRYPESIADYARAVELKPEIDFLLGQYLHTKMTICDWSDFQHLTERLISAVMDGKMASPPFQVLTLSDSEEVSQRVAATYASDICPTTDSYAPSGDRTANDRITVGYFSADFQAHAMMHLMAEFFELHDKERFRLIAFSFGPDIVDAMRERLVATFDSFIDVRDKSDREVAELSRKLGVDIAVDLSGYTKGCRPGIYAHRAAPLQVNYLGYPGTMGAEFIDYIIADPVVIPEANRPCFTEKVIYLPDCYQVNDAQRMTSDRRYTRAELELPEQAFVFCCFNNNFKITPETFDGWMRILGKVEGSVLWLLEDNPLAAANLRQEAEQRGVSPERLIFAKRMPFPDHLARHRAADLFIDSLPYNAHTTASDALLAGLPVLTRIGHTFAGRVAASLLTAIGLPELITPTQETFEALAVELATTPDRLAGIKRKLEAQRTTTALFDTVAATRHIENAYDRILERHKAGMAPDHLFL